MVATWFRRHRSRALTLLTFLGGFASVIFVPLATWLVERLGWRAALVRLALLHAGLTLPVHALLLRRSPADLGLAPDGDAARHAPAPEPDLPADAALRSRPFRSLVLAFSLGSLVTTALTVHLIPLLLERGYDATFAGAALGGVGLMALPGRLVLTPLGSRWPRPRVAAAIFLLQALGALVLVAGSTTAHVWVFVVLFGAGFGAITPARAALVAELWGAARFGRISGVLALPLALARAAAPVGASLLWQSAGYGAVLWVLAGLAAAAGGAVLFAR